MNRLLYSLIPALALAGCISFGEKAPKSLLTLTPSETLPVGATQNSSTEKSITITVPVVPQSLAAGRVPVQTGDQIAYITNVAWVEVPQRLFARLLSDTIAAKTGRVVLSSAQSFSDPGARLSGELRNFGVDGTSREVVVTFDASLIRGSATSVDKKRFEARVPIATINGDGVGPALNVAANRVASEVAVWIGN